MASPVPRPAALLPALLAAALAGCVQPLQLARDDSPVVLAHQRIAGPSPAQPGAYPVRRMYYGSGTDLRRAEYRDSVTIRTSPVNGSKLATASPQVLAARKKYWGFGLDAMPVNGRVWYPEGPGPFPLVLIVHGNHDMRDFSDPGYAYLGELLASRGYILVSVDENFLNGGLGGENDARGWMLLKHLEAWRRWNDSTGGPFHRKVDMDRIALMGHSRGGEAVAVAAAFNRLAYYPDDFTLRFDFNFQIQSLVAIAPVDGQYQPANRPTPVSDVNYLVFHGSHDGDVSSFVGLRQYQRVRFTTDTVPRFKAALWMYRANHGQWNTGWRNLDNGPTSARWLDLRGLLPLEEQLRFGEVVISAFLDATLRGRREYLPLFQDHRSAGGWLPKTIYLTRFQPSGFRPLADYMEDVDLTTGTADGVRIEGDSLGTWREGMVRTRSTGNNDLGHNAVWIGWNNRIAGPDTTRLGRPAAYRLHLPDTLAAAWSVDHRTALQLSLLVASGRPGPRTAPRDSTADSTARPTPPRPPARPRTPPGPDTTTVELSVELVDQAGVRVLLLLGDYAPVRRPPEMTVRRRAGRDRRMFGNLYEQVLQTFTVPLADARRADARFDPARLASVGLVFDRTVAGTVMVSDIGLASLESAFFVPRSGADR